MATVKKYLDYAGLGSYDTQLKAWANGASQLGFKKVLKSADGNVVYFFADPNATLSDVTVDTPSINLGSSDVVAQIASLASVLGATWDSSNEEYTIGLDNGFDASITDAVAAINDLKGAVDLLNEDNTTAGSVAKAIKDAVEALDATEFALASKDASTNVVTIKGIKEVDGVIAVGTDSTNDITLAAVAATGEAGDVSNTAIAGVTKTVEGTDVATTNVQDTLEALKGLIDNAGSAGAITIDEVSTGLSTGILKAYQVYQGGTQTAGVTTGGTLIGTVNIPKDFLVKSAEVKTVTAADKAAGGIFENDTDFAEGDKYIDFIINSKDANETAEHIYLNVNVLVDAYTAASNASEVQLAISNTNEISATVVKVAGTKVIYKAAYTDNTDPENPINVPEETVVDALNNIGSIPLTGTNSIASLFA